MKHRQKSQNSPSIKYTRPNQDMFCLVNVKAFNYYRVQKLLVNVIISFKLFDCKGQWRNIILQQFCRQQKTVTFIFWQKHLMGAIKCGFFNNFSRLHFHYFRLSPGLRSANSSLFIELFMPQVERCTMYCSYILELNDRIIRKFCHKF